MYNAIDQQIHQLSQTIAKFNRSLVAEKEDDSHTNLRFDFLGRNIWGHWANLEKGNYMLGLDLRNQQLLLQDKNYKTIVAFTVLEKRQVAVENEIANYLTAEFGIVGQDVFKPLHFEIPVYDFKNDLIKKWRENDIENWASYRHLANQACTLLADSLNVEADIKIWPHHFDTGVYIEANKQLGIGFGFAMADAMVNEAYFYCSVYGLNGNTVDYNTVKPLEKGYWITSKDWNGAVLKLSDVSEKSIETYLRQSLNWALTQNKP